MKTKIFGPSDIKPAASLLQAGELVAFPTETVYGLGAPLFAEDSIRKIFLVKGRPSDNPLIVHLADPDQIRDIALEIPEMAQQLITHFCPGPLTLVLKKKGNISPLVSGGLDTVALRIPKHEIARALIQETGVPLVAPSANLSGRPSSTELAHVLEDFEGKIGAVIDGGKSILGIESTVVLCVGPKLKILRPGHITQEEIEKVVGSVGIEPAAHAIDSIPLSPGMKYRHYAPKAPMRLFYDRAHLLDYLERALPKKRMLLSKEKEGGIYVDHFPLSAQELYGHLRFSDANGYEEILVFCDEKSCKDLALMNRLKKGSAL